MRSGRSEEADLLEMGMDDPGKCLDERSGRVEHGRPLEPNAFLSRQLFELDVDVVQDLDVIRDEADRRQQDLTMPRLLKLPQHRFYRRPQPRLFRASLA